MGFRRSPRSAWTPVPVGSVQRLDRWWSAYELPPIHPLARWPAGDRDGHVVDPRNTSFRAVGEGMGQEPLVIPLRIVRALMGPAGLPSFERALDDGLRHVQHVGKLEGRGQLRVEGMAAVVEGEVLKALLQSLQSAGALFQARLRPIDARALLHD